jgi:putative peptide zinc metalloprotease protein
MLVEVFVAALAFYAWLAVEPGIVRAVCFNIMLVAGVSTLVFNGNPLLRYDAYYILTDLVQLPNLARQAARYWGYLAERYLLRSRDAESPATTTSERLWFGFYGLASTLYRLFVAVAIALFIGSQFFFIGVLLALWSVATMVVMPVVKALQQLWIRPALRERRGALLGAGAGVLGVLALAAVFLPVPFRTQAEGVLWLPEQALVRAGGSGFITRLEARPDDAVQSGEVLVRSRDSTLEAQLRLAQARVREQSANYLKEFVADPARAGIAARQLALEEEALSTVQSRADALLARAGMEGVFRVPQAADMVGRYHRKGELLGYVLGAVQPVVRVVVEQAQADAVAAQTEAVAVRLADAIGDVRRGRVARVVPAAADEAPSGALMAAGGGQLAGDPRDPQGRKPLQRIFVIDVELAEPLAQAPAYGQRAHVRFDHRPQPLAVQWYAALRRLFLTHFTV